MSALFYADGSLWPRSFETDRIEVAAMLVGTLPDAALAGIVRVGTLSETTNPPAVVKAAEVERSRRERTAATFDRVREQVRRQGLAGRRASWGFYL